jgi:poly(3-hydroxybutyrate) depolymerase
MKPQRLTELRVEFASQGALLRGRLLFPGGASTRRPTLIMAHGTTATVQMVMIEYARVFARHGLAVLIYDHRNFGESGGEPRSEINPWIQARGYLDAMSFAATRPEVDPDRIGLWGDSYSGGQVVLVAACDERPKVVVAQVPVFGAARPPLEPSPGALEAIRETLLSGDVAGSADSTTGPLPVVSADQMGTPSLLTPIQAYRWFIEYGGRPGSGWSNRVTRVIPPTPVPFSPFLCAPFVSASTLLMVAPEDEMVHADYEVARGAFDLLPGPKRWVDIADGHFGLLYYPGQRFDEAASVQTEFLQEHL